MTAAELIVAAFAAYLLVGLVFGLAFVSVGVGRFDPAARGTSPAFRALILPGERGPVADFGREVHHPSTGARMTRHHRAVHVWVWVAVGVTVGAAFTAWLVARGGAL